MIISILNHKGGTGKTTTTINLGKALSLRKKSVLLIDLDSQANLSYSLGIDTKNNKYNVGEVLFKKIPIKTAIITKEGMDVIPADTNLYEYEEAIIKNNYGYTLLKDVLKGLNYDFILIDCPPSQSQLNINALCASDKILVPMIMDVLSLQGLNQILNTVKEIKVTINPKLEFLGILAVLVDERRHLTTEILQYVQNNYPITVFNNYVRANVKAAEAPSHGQSLLEYAPNSRSAKDYISVANELLKIYNN